MNDSRFRILIMWRANAGKTTVLNKVFDSVEGPEIFSLAGEKIGLAAVQGSAERGVHDVNNGLVFKSNPGFIFHDSPGIESGSTVEFEKIKTFISERAASNSLADQLHAIWYCLPTDTTRPLLAADEDFFNKTGAGKVPVIAVFTKHDGLLTEAFSELVDDGDRWEDALVRRGDKAKEILATHYIGPLTSSKFPPADYVQLKDMREATSGCEELMQKTGKALNTESARLLFTSAQRKYLGKEVFFHPHPPF
ncbi:hypothetical protein C8R43DRAFT_910520 [Mycena crocata]|nr:hypothetical protein C8R43DRAFT_910520 [Mycena crocata]